MFLLIREIFFVNIRDLSVTAGCAILVSSVVSLVAAKLAPYIGFHLSAAFCGGVSWLIFAPIINRVRKSREKDDT